MSKSPVSIPFTTDGVEVAVKDNTALPANARGNLAAGLDPSNNTQFLNVTAAGDLKVDGSGVTQPVSGTVTANVGTTGGLSLDATLTGGTQKTIVRGGAKGATAPADVTSTSTGTNHRSLDVAIYDDVGNQLGIAGAPVRVDPTGTTPQPITDNGGSLTVDGTVTSQQGTAAALAGRWPVIVTDGTNTMPTSDVAARAGFTKITNGTNTAAVTAGGTSPVLSDPSLVVQISPNQDPIPTTVVPATSIAGSAIGRVSGVAANVFTPVRQTTYVEQTTQAQRSIVSTSANDSSAGTGARQVIIYYLDATGAGPFTETVTLNGLTAVNTVNTNICFIERMQVVSVGSNGSNVGTLNLYTGTGATGTIFAAIGVGAVAAGVGDNETFYAHHYVPVGYKVSGYYVSVGIIASAGGGSSVSVIRYRNPTSSTSPWRMASDFINAAQGTSGNRTYYVSIAIPGPLVVLGYATPGTNNSTATMSFDYADAPV